MYLEGGAVQRSSQEGETSELEKRAGLQSDWSD